jgi:hypothetical protein
MFADWVDSVEALAPSFNVAAADIAKVRDIDWTQTKQQVFFGEYEIEDLIDSTAVVWPVSTISVSGAASPVDGKLFARFQGDAVARVRIHYSWKQGKALPNTAGVTDLISASFIRTLLDPSWGEYLAGGVQWTAESEVTISNPIQSAENWLQTVTFEMTFHVEE